jgi:hypothetical protein
VGLAGGSVGGIGCLRSGSWVLLLTGWRVTWVHWLRGGGRVLLLTGWGVNRVGGRGAGLLIDWVVGSLSIISLVMWCNSEVRDIQKQGSRWTRSRQRKARRQQMPQGRGRRPSSCWATSVEC